MPKEITTSVYTFETMISGGALYIDKTRWIWKMVSALNGQYFLARPRRFGKSLTVSTLEAVFRGKKELFSGLYIGAQAYDWPEHPVIHLDFARSDTGTLSSLQEWLTQTFREIGESYGVSPKGTTPALLFESLIRALYLQSGKGVVILIDEYDKPLLDHLEDDADIEAYRDAVDRVYQVLKGAEPYLRFVFLTGVTKFSKVSVFSKLNNLNDISRNQDFACMCGYTQAELESGFAEYLESEDFRGLRDDEGILFERERALAEVKYWYDGFCFHANTESVYNPVSIGKFFQNHCEFSNYWFETGTPTFLMRLLHRRHLVLADLQEAELSDNSFSVFNLSDLSGRDVSNENVLQLLFQTGYLTIDRLLRTRPQRVYSLRFPNHEVELSVTEGLISEYCGSRAPGGYVNRILSCAWNGDTKGMISWLENFFADLPYDIQIRDEKYYQSMTYAIFRLCGMEITAEERTNIGRIDAVMNAGKHLYIVEFKLNRSPEEALKQIDEKRYAEKYLMPAKKSGQTIHKLGINFVYTEGARNISGWQEDIL